jgi:peptidyl-prolyl cis-trans isomerase SurA
MRVTKLIFIILPLLFSITCNAQNSKVVVAEFGDYKIYLDEFENSYVKNSGGLEKAKKDSLSALKNYLDLFVNYRMKLRNADVRGYKTDPEMQKELNEYKGNLGSTIILEKEIYEPNLHKLYERRKTEIRASHIMLMPDSNTTEAQVTELAKKLIDRINKGEDFAALAKEYSKDPNTSKNGGDVYYFTAGQINSPELEDLLYGLDAGQVTQTPFKFNNASHIIKITERQPRKASIHAQHILIKYADSSNVADTAKALAKIKSIQEELKHGADFSELAKKYSQDTQSAKNGGDLNLISRGMMIRPFEEAAFKLAKGQISDIVKTPFGFHLIRVTDITKYPEYEADKEELKNIYMRIGYSRDYDRLINKFRTEYNYKFNKDTFDKIAQKNSDTAKVNEHYWKSDFHKDFGSSPIFSINGKDYIIDSLISALIKKNASINMKIDARIIEYGAKNYSSDLLLQMKALDYDKANPEFADLINEYEKGMYLFKLLDDEVWTKIKLDSTKVEEFWKQNKENFKWKDRVEFKEIYVLSDSTINKAYSMAVSGMNYDSVYVKLNQRAGAESKPGYTGLVNIDANELAKHANALKNIGDISKPFKMDDGWSIVKLIKRDSVKLKTYDEAKAEAASMLQEKESKRLEDEYIDRLKEIYHPKMYYNELEKAFK